MCSGVGFSAEDSDVVVVLLAAVVGPCAPSELSVVIYRGVSWVSVGVRACFLSA